MSYLDNNSNVISWSSEELYIPYLSPIDNRIHKYYPDFLVKKRNKEGNVDIVMVEIKPYYQTMPPKIKKKVNKQYLYEVKTWGVNKAKWESAKKYCEKRGWDFILITENELGLKF